MPQLSKLFNVPNYSTADESKFEDVIALTTIMELFGPHTCIVLVDFYLQAFDDERCYFLFLRESKASF